ncbi:lipopolysaccharide biosynthesis protein [Thomasclavelia cocleata]|uniref:lipopolysaccharide biosynthesis protein n=1 Tax=Thomasclavelia cocleata TaxID=69824 RepID=UPI00272B307C|nr:lipopolysaccharide biosynthesis protein [Thomasclavelia cocleata]
MNNKNDLGTKITKGIFWSMSEKILANGVSFAVSLILARLILPEEYGLISLITIFINISNVFVESGFGNALIQKQDTDDKDFHTVFIFEILVSFALYLFLFFTAPIIAEFYKEKKLVNILRIYGLVIILGSIKNIQHAYVSKKMEFRLFFFSTLGGTLASAIIGIILAYIGFGVWALVAQVMMNSLMDSIVLYIKIDWKPKLYFSFDRLKSLYSYGWKILATGLLSTVYNNLYGLFIGKIYNTEQLALYNKGNSFPTLISNNVSGPIQSVTFPALSLVQDDKSRLKEMTKKTLIITSYVLWPMLFGMAAVAIPMITILITDKWINCVIFLQINVVATLFWPISSANGQLINAVGRSDLSLKLDIIKKIVGILLLVCSIPFGIVTMAWGRAVGQFFASVCDAYPNKRIIQYDFIDQIRDLMPNMLANIIMFVIVYAINFIEINIFIKLVLQIIVGCMIYLICSILLKLEGLNYVKYQLAKIFGK